MTSRNHRPMIYAQNLAYANLQEIFIDVYSSTYKITHFMKKITIALLVSYYFYCISTSPFSYSSVRCPFKNSQDKVGPNNVTISHTTAYKLLLFLCCQDIRSSLKGSCDHVYTLAFNYMYCILCNDIVINPILHFV